MSNRIVAGLAAATAAVTAVSCSGVGAVGGGPVEVTFSYWALTAPPLDEFNQVIDDFNASQNEYEVVPENIPYDNYHQTVLTQAAAGQGPTIITLDSSEFANAVDAGLATELSGLVDLPDGELSAYEKSLEVDGERYGVTFGRHPYALLVNTKMLDKIGKDVPTNYAEFEAIAREYANPPETYGVAFRHTTADTNGWWLDLSNWIQGSGGRWSTDDGTPTIDTPEMERALTRMKTLLDNKVAPLGTDAPTYRRLFWEQKIPMLVESLAFGGIFVAQSPALAKNLEVHKLPFEDQQYLSSNNPVFINSSASDEERAGAAEFLSYMLSPDVQRQMVDTLGGVLVSEDIPLSREALAENPWLKTWKAEDSELDFTPTGVGSNFHAFRDAVLEQIDLILAGDVSVEEGLKQAQADAEEVMAD